MRSNLPTCGPGAPASLGEPAEGQEAEGPHGARFALRWPAYLGSLAAALCSALKTRAVGISLLPSEAACEGKEQQYSCTRILRGRVQMPSTVREDLEDLRFPVIPNLIQERSYKIGSF